MISFWKTTALAILLAIFLSAGIAHIINPDWYIKRSSVQKGGELLTGWNRFEFRVAGAIFAGLAAYFLYVLFR